VVVIPSVSNMTLKSELIKSDGNLVRGCVSRVWVIGHGSEAGGFVFRCDAESPMVKGLAALLCDLVQRMQSRGGHRLWSRSVWSGCGFDKHALANPAERSGGAEGRGSKPSPQLAVERKRCQCSGDGW
jgi:hypothetical protein